MRNRRKLSDVITAGFRAGDDAAFVSLGLALKAWFGTHRTASLAITDQIWRADYPEDPDGFHCTPTYRGQYSLVIVHFHHFFELTIKRLLRGRHPLLATIAPKDIVVFDKLLHGDTPQAEEVDGLNTVEFSEAIARLETLVRSGRVSAPEAATIASSRVLLDNLNTLRNRTLHRGSFILLPLALDELVGGHLLPIILKLVRDSTQPHDEGLWKYEKLSCGVDPITSVAEELSKPSFSVRKLVLLKELGRAAYENRIVDHPFVEIINREIRERAATLAQHHQSRQAQSVSECPVCGTKSLVVQGPSESPTTASRLESRAECVCCTFSPREDVGNASELGVPGVPDLWIHQSEST